MTVITVIGALLMATGIVLMAFTTIQRGRMSKPRNAPGNPSGPTLEPAGRSMGFLSVKSNWPGILAMVVGAILVLMPLIYGI